MRSPRSGIYPGSGARGAVPPKEPEETEPQTMKNGASHSEKKFRSRRVALE